MAFTVVGGGQSAYIPSTNDLATGALQVEFTRSVNTFPLTRYAQIVPVTKMEGYYLRQDVADNARVSDMNEFIWPLGNDAPTGKQNAFEFLPYSCRRYGFPFYIPQETANQAAWDVVAQHARTKAQLAMTRRTIEAATALSTSGNWGGNYASDPTVAAIGAGYWQASSVLNGHIQKTIQTVLQLIGYSSAGAVQARDVIMVISPKVAQTISQAPEIKEYVKFMAQSVSFLQGSDTFSRWGIPQTLFGLGDVVVDDSVKVTSKKGATNAQSWVLGDGAYFVSRPNGLVGVEGGSSFATLQIFAYEDMTVEQFNDPQNRRMVGRVIDNSVSKIVAPVAGYAIGNVISA
jgi:hypothetical protein